MNSTSSLRLSSTIPWTAVFFLSLVVVSYLGLIGLGQWLLDEYNDFSALARDGWHFLLVRLKWSPRPLAESLFVAYGWVVNHLHRPLIGPFLGILWAGFIAAGLLTFWQANKDRAGKELWPDLLPALALMALFLTSGSTTEVFYWPAAAVAYLPTLSATLLLFLQVAAGRLGTSAGRSLCGFCLLIAGGCSEVGAAFVGSYALIQAASWVIAAIQKRRGLPVLRTPVLWWLIPGAVSAFILLVVRLNRYYQAELPGGFSRPTLGHPFASALAGARELLAEALGLTAHSHVAPTVASEMLLALGVGLCWYRVGGLSRTVVRQTMAVAAAFLLASLFSISAAYLHFGILCCDRHETIRRCWILMSITGFAMAPLTWHAAERLRRYASSRVAAPLLLCAAVLCVWHTKAILREYRDYGAVQHAREENFRFGFRSGSPQMVFLLARENALIPGPQLAPGIYTQASESSDYPRNILSYFNKQSMVVRSATDWLHDQ